MKLTKVLSLMVAICVLFSMTFTMTTSANFADVSAEASYSESVQGLTALNILNGYDEDGVKSFKPENKITRAEFAKVIACALSMRDAADANKQGGIFTDVAEADWFSGFVATAYNLKIVNGKGDGTFAPNAEVTYEEAVKMIVAAIGYTIKAERLGGWPTGFMMVANQEGITVGTQNVGGGATRAVVARLVYNALTVPLMDQVDFSDDGGIERVKDQSLLLTKLGVIKAEAKISSVPLSKTERNINLSYSNLDTVAKNYGWYAKLGATSSYIGVTGNQAYLLSNNILRNDVNVAGYQGLLVTALIDVSDDSEPKLLAVIPKAGKNKELVIKPTLLVKSDNAGYVEYYKDITDDKTTKEKISTDIINSTYVNLVKGSYTTDVKNAANITTQAEYKYVDTDNDGSYDTVFVANIESFVIGSVNTGSHKIFRDTATSNISSTFTKASLSLDPTNDSINYVIKKDGAEITLADLKAGDIANVKTSIDSSVEYYEIIISNDTVSGTVSEISTETNKAKVAAGKTAAEAKETFYRIGDKDYQFFPSLTAARAGDTINGLVALNGRVISYVLDSVTRDYAVVVATNVSNEFGNTYQLQMVKADGTLATLNFAKKINGSSTDYSTADAAAFATAYPKGSLIAYELNSNGEIKNIRKQDEVALLDSTLKGVTLAATDIYKASSDKIGSNYFVEKSSVFACEETTQAAISKDNVVLGTPSMLEDDTGYVGFAIVNDSKEIQAMFVYGAGNTVKWNDYPFVITRVATTTVDNDTRVKYSGFKNGEEASITVAADKNQFDNFNANDVILYSANANGELTNAYKIAGINTAGTYYEVYTNARWSAAETTLTSDEDNDNTATNVRLYQLSLAKTPAAASAVVRAGSDLMNGANAVKMQGFAFAGKAYDQKSKNVTIINAPFADTFLPASADPVVVAGTRFYGTGDAFLKDYAVNGNLVYIYNASTDKMDVTSIGDLETERNTNDYSVVGGRDNDDSIYVYSYDGDTYFALIVDAAGE